MKAKIHMRQPLLFYQLSGKLYSVIMTCQSVITHTIYDFGMAEFTTEFTIIIGIIFGEKSRAEDTHTDVGINSHFIQLTFHCVSTRYSSRRDMNRNAR